MNRIKKVSRKRDFHRFIDELERRKAKCNLSSLYGKCVTDTLKKEEAATTARM